MNGANHLRMVITMTNYREILCLRSLGLNHSRIAEGMGISRQTVVTALQRAQAQELDWRTAESLPDSGRGYCPRRHSP